MLKFVFKVVIILLLLGGGIFLFPDIEMHSSFLKIIKNDDEYTSLASDEVSSRVSGNVLHLSFNVGNYIVEQGFAPINLSQRCIVSSLAYNEHDGVLSGCSDGTLEILEIQSGVNSVLTPSDLNLGGAILGITWYEHHPIVLAADANVAGQALIYRFSKQDTGWQMSKQYKGNIAVNEVSTLYSVDDIGVLSNSKDGVYLIDRKKMYVLLPNERVIYAGGTKDFYVIQSKSDMRSNLYFYMGDIRILSLESLVNEAYTMRIVGVSQTEHERKVNFLYNGNAYTIALK